MRIARRAAFIGVILAVIFALNLANGNLQDSLQDMLIARNTGRTWCRTARGNIDFDTSHEGRGDDAGNIILDGEDVPERAVIVVRPCRNPGTGIAQAGGDAYAVLGFPDFPPST